jgi:hypothetical protein
MYADLDMECLRAMDSLLEREMDTFIASHSRDQHSPSHPLYQLAVVGSMKTVSPHILGHSIPNAWMASTPGHPFWLLTISSAMETMGADEEGKVTEDAHIGWLKKIGFTHGHQHGGPEALTGPVALRNQVLVYQYWEKSSSGTPGGAGDGRSEQDLPRHPALQLQNHQVPLDARHGLKVLRPSIIYPFSWDTEVNPLLGPTYQKCRIQIGTEEKFDPAGCQGESPLQCVLAAVC